MSASRTRRQMIQRMGRILRRKRPGVAARFVIMFAKDTLEDPANRIERDGFLDEIERISEATRRVRRRTVRGARRVPRRAGPGGRSRARASRALRARRGGRACESPAERSTDWTTTLADELGVEAAYAFLSFARGRSVRPATRGRDPPARRSAPPARTPTRRTSSSSSPSCPQIAKPRVEPKRLSTGQAPLEIARIGSAWRISCTGCGEASPLVQFRWQVLDQTVACRCED